MVILDFLNLKGVLNRKIPTCKPDHDEIINKINKKNVFNFIRVKLTNELLNELPKYHQEINKEDFVIYF